MVGILGVSSAVAEESGAFMGVEANFNFDFKTKKENNNAFGMKSIDTKSPKTKGQIGILAGYKKFFTPEFGLRAYGLFSYGGAYDKETSDKLDTNDNKSRTEVKNTSNAYSINANIEALYNFISTENADFGAFAGLGYTYTKNTQKTEGINSNNTTKSNDFQVGINAGLRANIAQKHGLEFVLIRNTDDNIGIRYIYTF